jgi:hypothetical protein
MYYKFKIMQKRILFILFIAIGYIGVAQTLRFTPPQLTATNVHFGDSIVMIDTVYNIGSTPFVGPLWLYTQIDAVNSSSDSIYLLVNNDTLYPGRGNGRVFSHIFHITSPLYRVGPSTIVIWPLYNGNPAGSVDSIGFTVYTWPLGIDENPLARAFLYQSNGSLLINFGDAENLVKQVRIYDILGKEIYADAADRSHRIPTAQWQSGIYLCEITTTTGQRKVIKINLSQSAGQ